MVASFIKHFINAKHKLRDPIYGYIWLTDSEMEIIDTPLFQRLRRIGQLALTKYVYPTAEHSRFVHSLGVLQVATDMFEEVLRSNPDMLNGNEIGNPEADLKTLRFAALLHDIGHMPFSHALEKIILEENITHEDVGKYIIQNYPEIVDIIKKNGVSPNAVASLLKGKTTQEYTLLKKFISGEFDADRADYLLRDSYFCGVKYGEYDYIRYAGSFTLTKDPNEQLVFAVEKGNIHAIEAFLLARYHYYLQVPYHRTRKGYDLVLKRYFRHLKKIGELPVSGLSYTENELNVDFNQFNFFDDYAMFQKIKEDAASGNLWAMILMRQDRLHPIFGTTVDSEKNRNDFVTLQELLQKKGLSPDEDFFTFDKKVQVHNLLAKSDEMGKNFYQVVDKRTNGNKLIGSLIDYSSILAAVMEKPAHIRLIYVTSSTQDKAKGILKHYNNLSTPEE